MSESTVEVVLLRYLADEQFCSEYELALVAQAADSEPARTRELLELWRTRGWVESVPGEAPEEIELFHLTDQGYAAAASYGHPS